MPCEIVVSRFPCRSPSPNSIACAGRACRNPPRARAPAASAIAPNARLASVVGRNGAPCGGRRTRCGRSSLAGPVSGMFLMASPRVRWWWLGPGVGERIRATSWNGFGARNGPGKSSAMTMPGPASCHFEPPKSNVTLVTSYQVNSVSVEISSFGNERAHPGPVKARHRAARSRPARPQAPIEHARPARRCGPSRRRARRDPGQSKTTFGK